jgi:hypothetical protein
MLGNCCYSKAFSDVHRKDEKKMLESITKNAEYIRTYVELF